MKWSERAVAARRSRHHSGCVQSRKRSRRTRGAPGARRGAGFLLGVSVAYPRRALSHRRFQRPLACEWAVPAGRPPTARKKGAGVRAHCRLREPWPSAMANGGVLSPWSPLCRRIWPEPSLILLTSTGTPVCPWTSRDRAQPDGHVSRHPPLSRRSGSAFGNRCCRAALGAQANEIRSSVRGPAPAWAPLHAARVAASAVEANLRPCTRTLSAAQSPIGSVGEPALAYAQLPHWPRIRRPRRGQHPARPCTLLVRGDEALARRRDNRALVCPSYPRGRGGSGDHAAASAPVSPLGAGTRRQPTATNPNLVHIPVGAEVRLSAGSECGGRVSRGCWVEPVIVADQHDPAAHPLCKQG